MLWQRAGQVSQRTVIELELIALLLLEPTNLSKRIEHIAAALPDDAEDSLLLEFHTVCLDCHYDDRAILHHYRQRDEGRILFERLLTQEQREDQRIDIDTHMRHSLSRLRELYLSSEKENQRKRLLERMQEVSSYLTDPNLPTDKLQQYYSELKEINAMLQARDAERRMRVSSSLQKRKRR